MQDYLLESLKLQRIDFFIKLVAASECSDDEKRLAIMSYWPKFVATNIVRRWM